MPNQSGFKPGDSTTNQIPYIFLRASVILAPKLPKNPKKYLIGNSDFT